MFSKTALNFVFKNTKYSLKKQNFSKLVSFDKISDQNGYIGTLGLNSPKNRNAFSAKMVQEINHLLDDIHNDLDIRSLILRSHVAGVFCAGADLKERATMTQKQVGDFVLKLRKLTKRIYDLQVPVIAAIDGVALGGGLELALSCDIRVASLSAKMGLVEAKLAIIPGAGGTQYLPRIINPALAKELIYTARVLDGTEAKELGLVSYAVEQNESNDAAYLKSLEIANKILANGPLAIKMAKKAINLGLDNSLEDGLMAEEACYGRLIPTDDRVEALKAFSEKRPPRYKGE